MLRLVGRTLTLSFLVLSAAALTTPAPTRRVVPSRAGRNGASASRASCARCVRPVDVCICTALPSKRLATTTRVLVLQHPAEAKKKVASTVPLIRAALAPESCDVILGNCFSVGTLPTLRAAIDEGFEPLLLYPGPAARPLADYAAVDAGAASAVAVPAAGAGAAADAAASAQAPAAASARAPEREARPRKVLLVLLDGTWVQAHHMLRHSAGLLDVATQEMFDSEVESEFEALRREPAGHCMSTAEACASARCGATSTANATTR